MPEFNSERIACIDSGTLASGTPDDWAHAAAATLKHTSSVDIVLHHMRVASCTGTIIVDKNILWD